MTQQFGRIGERMVTLIDGREVSNYSEEWRHECEARHIARLPSKADRHAYLAKVGERRKLTVDQRWALRKLAEKIFYADLAAKREAANAGMAETANSR